jgi:TonB family protein
MVLLEEGVSRKKYASLLLELLPMTNINKELSVNMAQETSNLKKRIQMIAQQSRNKPIPKRASFAIFITVLACTAIAMACTDMQTQQIFDNEELNLMTDVDYDGNRGYHQILIFMSDEEQANRHLSALNQLQNLHPEHIMSIDVLKGDTAVELYGKRGSDGVIQINTNLSENSYNSVLETLGMNQVDLSLTDPYEAEEIFVVVEQMPELIGGLESIQRELLYPETARRAGIEGRVYVQFVVDEEGNVTYPRVTRGIGGGADEEALRAVSLAKFRPAMQRGQPVKVHFTLPIFFKLPESESNQTIQPATSVNIENPAVLEREMKLDIQRTGNIINGRVLDPDSNQPLVGANIIIEGSTIGATTNNDGRFSLDISEFENGAVTVSYVGYARTRINI